MLLFFALFFTALIGFFEWNHKQWVESEQKIRIVRMSIYGILTCLGIALLLRLSLDSYISTLLLSPFVAYTLWRLIDAAYLVGSTKLTISVVVITIFLGTLLCLPLLSLNLQQQLFVEYLLDFGQPVPPIDSIHPEADRIINV
jgi:Sec-independent protein secretion pathway component TatC